MANYLVCYDIADPRRLQRVHRHAVRHAQFVQYSVYYLQGSEADLQAMLDDIAAEIHPKLDDVRAYAIAPLEEAFTLGRTWIPEGIYLV